ncbi:unnamed protein product [Leptidea sinapis]|uniref:Uncharacterized protein n=1 Tax=Leptidea sinapis TaxID=189913 RepID=A0A5E4PRK9_9NEOP|nr:unnamed protein product [Leptidea sinapis]
MLGLYISPPGGAICY